MGEDFGELPAGASDYFGRRVAVIDIGSNSIRLVVFEGSVRAPTPIFNEKVMCGLGRGMQSSGRLNPAGVTDAHENLGRFVGAAAAMKVANLSAFATAAVREAEDGSDFIEALRRRLGLEVRVLSGEDEARLSAYGVMAGFPQAEGPCRRSGRRQPGACSDRRRTGPRDDDPAARSLTAERGRRAGRNDRHAGQKIPHRNRLARPARKARRSMPSAVRGVRWRKCIWRSTTGR